MAFVALTGEAGGGRGERLIILRSFKSITIPIYKRTTATVVLGASIMCNCRLEQEIGNKTVIYELYKTG